eukprot:8659122-Pyramimonas_sp.AAC.1
MTTVTALLPLACVIVESPTLFITGSSAAPSLQWPPLGRNLRSLSPSLRPPKVASLLHSKGVVSTLPGDVPPVREVSVARVLNGN